MDEQQKSHRGPSSETVPPLPEMPGESAGSQAGEPAGATINETIERARTIARNVGEQVRTAASNAGSAAQDFARRAREQTSFASDKVYEQSARAGQYLTRNVNEYPLTALLVCGAVAGAIGYGLAYLIHSGRRGEEEKEEEK